METKGVLHVNDESITKATSKGVALVDFWAEWCMPCRMQGPILEKVANRVGSQALVCKLDVESNPVSAERFGITSIPLLYLFKDGKVERRFVGVQNEETLVKAIEELSN